MWCRAARDQPFHSAFHTPHSALASPHPEQLKPPLVPRHDPLPVRRMLRPDEGGVAGDDLDRKSTRLNSSHSQISYAVFCLKKQTASSLMIQVRRSNPLYHYAPSSPRSPNIPPARYRLSPPWHQPSPRRPGSA